MPLLECMEFSSCHKRKGHVSRKTEKQFFSIYGPLMMRALAFTYSAMPTRSG
jgi:hypothetical protein